MTGTRLGSKYKMGYFQAKKIMIEQGGTTVLRNASMSLERSEVFCILGPSGVGKSTLIRAILGLHKIQSGSIKLDGNEISNLPPNLRNLSVAFQTPALFDHLTASENILLAHHDISMMQQVADTLGIGDILHKYPNELSGGERQRVSLCRALLRESAMLLLDEPFSALDICTKKSAHEYLLSAHAKHGKTTLFVTHDQDEAMKLSNRICIINNGAIEQIDTPQVIYNRPATRFIAQFIGKNNIMPGCVIGYRKGVARVYIDDLKEEVIVSVKNNLELNQRIWLSIRPENIVISRKKGILAKVISREYLGHSTIVKAILNTGYQIQAMTSGHCDNSNVFLSWRSNKNFTVLG